jgi:hypothetical protein
MEARSQVDVLRDVELLVDEYRDRCLWFLDRTFRPRNAQEALWVLDLIERYGDRGAFERSARLRPWLSPHSN